MGDMLSTSADYLGQTEKAIAVLNAGNKKVWVAKSLLHNLEIHKGIVVFDIPENIDEEKDIY